MFLPVDAVNEFLSKVGGRFFHVTFQKQDGTTREMNCRMGVHKHLKGGESTTAHIPMIQGVYDLANGYRCFYRDRVIAMRCGEMAMEIRI